MIFLGSDFHLGHFRICEYCSRPFSSSEQMDESCIDYLNKTVRPQDTLYFLGDFNYGPDCQIKTESYRSKINCKDIRLILGNHDSHCKDHPHLWSWIKDTYVLKYNKRRIWLSHYGHYVWPGSHNSTLHAYGHSHRKPEHKFGFGRSMEVGYDPQQEWVISVDKFIDAVSSRDINAMPSFPLS
jgi:calcineurin-like phosphoesterase family protein